MNPRKKYFVLQNLRRLILKKSHQMLIHSLQRYTHKQPVDQLLRFALRLLKLPVQMLRETVFCVRVHVAPSGGMASSNNDAGELFCF